MRPLPSCLTQTDIYCDVDDSLISRNFQHTFNSKEELQKTCFSQLIHPAESVSLTKKQKVHTWSRQKQSRDNVPDVQFPCVADLGEYATSTNSLAPIKDVVCAQIDLCKLTVVGEVGKGYICAGCAFRSDPSFGCH